MKTPDTNAALRSTIRHLRSGTDGTNVDVAARALAQVARAAAASNASPPGGLTRLSQNAAATIVQSAAAVEAALAGRPVATRNLSQTLRDLVFWSKVMNRAIEATVNGTPCSITPQTDADALIKSINKSLAVTALTLQGNMLSCGNQNEKANMKARLARHLRQHVFGESAAPEAAPNRSSSVEQRLQQLSPPQLSTRVAGEMASMLLHGGPMYAAASAGASLFFNKKGHLLVYQEGSSSLRVVEFSKLRLDGHPIAGSAPNAMVDAIFAAGTNWNTRLTVALDGSEPALDTWTLHASLSAPVGRPVDLNKVQAWLGSDYVTIRDGKETIHEKDNKVVLIDGNGRAFMGRKNGEFQWGIDCMKAI